MFAPGNMYLFDNRRVLHGRASVLEVPRTSVGQSVPEQTEVDEWREMLTSRLTRVLEEKWLIQVPLAQLYELDKLVEALENYEIAILRLGVSLGWLRNGRRALAACFWNVFHD